MNYVVCIICSIWRVDALAVCFDKVKISVAALSMDYHINNNINNL